MGNDALEPVEVLSEEFAVPVLLLSETRSLEPVETFCEEHLVQPTLDFLKEQRAALVEYRVQRNY